MLGPHPGVLQDSGELLELQRPGAPGTNGVVPFITVDTVRYNDKAPGRSNRMALARRSNVQHPAAYGNDPANWQAAPTTAARPAPSPYRRLLLDCG